MACKIATQLAECNAAGIFSEFPCVSRCIGCCFWLVFFFVMEANYYLYLVL